MVAYHVAQFSNLEVKFQLFKYLEASIHAHDFCLLSCLFTSLLFLNFIVLQAQFKVL